MEEYHMLCLSCGEQQSDVPVKTKNCSLCNELYRHGVKNHICRKKNCNNIVLNPEYPMCIGCYKKVLADDKKLVNEYFNWEKR